MTRPVKLYITGGVLLFLSTLFVPQGLSDFARASAASTPVPPFAGLYLAIGAVLILTAIALGARAYYLIHSGSPGNRTPDE